MSINKAKEIELRLIEALFELNFGHKARLAKEAGVSKATVSNIFRGKPSNPSTLVKLQDKLKPISVNWILSGQGPKYLVGQKPEEKAGKESATYEEMPDLLREKVKEVLKNQAGIELEPEEADYNLNFTEEQLLERALYFLTTADLLKRNYYNMKMKELERDLVEAKKKISDLECMLKREEKPEIFNESNYFELKRPPENLGKLEKAIWNRRIEQIIAWVRENRVAAYWVPSWVIDHFIMAKGLECDKEAVGKVLREIYKKGLEADEEIIE